MAKIPKRCFFFDSDGKPRDKGCKRGAIACHFVHPEDREWDRTPDSHPPRYLEQASPRGRRGGYISRHNRSPSVPQSPTEPRADSHSRRLSGDEPELLRRMSGSLDNTLQHLNLDDPPPESPQMPAAMPPPPPPSYAPPALPPLPTPPSFLTTKPKPIPPPLTREEKKELWRKRTNILADAAQAHAQQRKFEQDLRSYEQIIQSSRFTALSESGKASLNSSVKKLQSQLDATKKQISDVVTSLSESDSWPVRPVIEEPARSEVDSSLPGVVEALKNSAEDISQYIMSIQESREPQLGSTDMDVDPPSEEQMRGLKRFRLSKDEYKTPAPTAAEIDEIREKFVHLSGVMSNISNDIHSHKGDTEAELNERMENKFEELSADKLLHVTATVPEAIQQKIDQIDKSANLIGDQLAELAQDSGSFVERANLVEIKLAQVLDDDARNKARYRVLNEKMQSLIEKREKQSQELAALTAAHAAYVSRPPSPPASPRPLHPEYLLQFLQDSLQDAVRAYMEPALDRMRTDTEAMMEAKTKGTCESMWEQLLTTRRLIEDITQVLVNGSGQPTSTS
ncbi:hypothetical protein BD779DRAFT_1797597 [Infundibulicybe gibba]|nr:hypothetical protein BD779DRAFT_1797597 [Infundibulicybe gibba]